MSGLEAGQVEGMADEPAAIREVDLPTEKTKVEVRVLEG